MLLEQKVLRTFYVSKALMTVIKHEQKWQFLSEPSFKKSNEILLAQEY